MSLEAAIAENTAAVKELTAALKEANEGRAAAAEAVREAVTGTSGTRGRPAGSKDKAKDKDKSKDETPAPDTKAPAPKPVTVEEFREKAGAWLNANAELKPARKDFVKSVTNHFGVNLLTEISADEFPKILGWFDEFAAGKKVNFSEGEDETPPPAPEPEEEEDDIG